MAFSGSQITRLGLYGGPRGLYGLFAGKTEAEVVTGRRRIFADNTQRPQTSIHTRTGRREIHPG